LISSVSALTVDLAPTLSSATDTSIQVDWEDVAGALGYYVYYSKTSGTQDGYDFEGVDLIEVSETTLENLDKDTEYFVAVTVVDDNGNESQYSPEASFSTGAQGLSEAQDEDAFALEEVVVLSANEIELNFNAVLDGSEDAVREIKLVEKESWEEIFISDISLDSSDPMKAVAMTTTDLVEESEYDLTIISMQDMDKNNIESGIDGLTTFVVPRGSTTSYEETDEIPVEVVDLEEETAVELNSASDEAEWSKAGQMLSEEELTKTAEMAAKENEALPETGPETILLLLLAIMLWWGLFFIHAKKA